MKFVKVPYRYTFSNNPIAFTLNTESGAINKVNIAVTVAGSTFSLSAYATSTRRVEFEISDLLKPFVNRLSESGKSVIVHDDLFLSYTVIVTASTSLPVVYVGKVLLGGISKEYILYYKRMNTNVFTEKFLNEYNNFLFSTRTSKQTIDLYREELGNIFFLTPSAENIVVKSGSNQLLLGTSSKAVPVSVNLRRLSETWKADDIHIMIGGYSRIHFRISDHEGEEKYVLKFRNSFGVFERLLVTSVAYSSSEFDNESANYNEYDSDLSDYRKSRRRVSSNKFIEVETGYKSTDNLFFIDDLLASDEIYFIDKGKVTQKCLVTAEGNKKRLIQREPEKLSLKIELVDSDSNFSPDMGDSRRRYLADNFGIPIVNNNKNISSN
ncbi:hypothetical protein LJC11_03045 [Bacteroidales bacterium OttesenSCG-928-I21]|nr:hypothetical protein [Bacteroidales bacterium OttesenSCG-928-I21]